MNQSDTWSSLSTLILILVVLFVSFILWLLLSSCLGVSVLSAISSAWDAALTGAQAGGTQGMARRRRQGLEGEDWEMEYRGRPG